MDLASFPDHPAYDAGSRAMALERGPRGEDFAKQILTTVASDLTKPVNQLDVLDVGCGYGHTTLALAKEVHSITGIEPCREPVLEAQRLQHQENANNATFLHQTIDEYQPDKRFDLIILDNVLEHLPDQEGALTRLAKWLNPGGVLYLLVPNKWWPIEVHYYLPFLGWLPLDFANLYLRLTGKGHDYRDASYAPGFLRIIRLMNRQKDWTWRFALPANLAWTTAGTAWHYRAGIALLEHIPLLWAVSKAFLIIAKKKVRRP
jgi:SAM-dependent methyltransferase